LFGDIVTGLRVCRNDITLLFGEALRNKENLVFQKGRGGGGKRAGSLKKENRKKEEKRELRMS